MVENSVHFLLNQETIRSTSSIPNTDIMFQNTSWWRNNSPNPDFVCRENLLASFCPGNVNHGNHYNIKLCQDRIDSTPDAAPIFPVPPGNWCKSQLCHFPIEPRPKDWIEGGVQWSNRWRACNSRMLIWSLDSSNNPEPTGDPELCRNPEG